MVNVPPLELVHVLVVEPNVNGSSSAAGTCSLWSDAIIGFDTDGLSQ